MQFDDLHVALAGDDAPFSRRMTLHFGAGTADAQIFCGKLVTFSLIETDNKNLAILAQAQFTRPRAFACHKISPTIGADTSIPGDRTRRGIARDPAEHRAGHKAGTAGIIEIEQAANE